MTHFSPKVGDIFRWRDEALVALPCRSRYFIYQIEQRPHRKSRFPALHTINLSTGNKQRFLYSDSDEEHYEILARLE